MVRKLGELGEYRGQLRKCHMSGFTFNESEMIRVDGKWYHPKYYDISTKQGAKRKRYGPA